MTVLFPIAADFNMNQL